ncbi:hypothetical protein Tco_1455635 [Tanacetum coccineum]
MNEILKSLDSNAHQERQATYSPEKYMLQSVNLKLWLLGDSDHSALSCDSEEEWMVNEKNDVNETSSVSVDERNSLPSEEDSNNLLSDRTIRIRVSKYSGGAIHFNTKNPYEPSELETSDNHNVAKELNGDFIEENISTHIGTLNNAAF